MKAFYLATLGGAKSLYLDSQLGNFAVGKEADFVVLDLAATPIMKRRMAQADSISDQLFALMMLGDDRAVYSTHVMGQCRYSRV
jgi:guanine deaminase